ncbi:hypothetical protein CL620_04920 [archaeon]|jgi:hypothetical protein|nr:hypothetical protein [archaeon]|tara:strand:- start:67 stop:399 length:333 start_codon:yes stop_codon:yes gene_type:complete
MGLFDEDVSKEEKMERMLWLERINEYISDRGSQSQLEQAMREYSMAQWDSSPSKRDFYKIFHIAIKYLRKDIDTKFIKPIERELDNEEKAKIKARQEASRLVRKRGRKSK